MKLFSSSTRSRIKERHNRNGVISRKGALSCDADEKDPSVLKQLNSDDETTSSYHLESPLTPTSNNSITSGYSSSISSQFIMMSSQLLLLDEEGPEDHEELEESNPEEIVQNCLRSGEHELNAFDENTDHKTNMFGKNCSVCGSTDAPSKDVKKVRFSTILIREYSRCAGDNPSVTCGVPIAIDWTVEMQHDPVSIDNWERALQEEQEINGWSGYRPSSQWCMSALDRANILKDWGYSRCELRDTARQVEIWRKQREDTVRRLHGNIVVRFFRRLNATLLTSYRSKTLRCSNHKLVPKLPSPIQSETTKKNNLLAM